MEQRGWDSRLDGRGAILGKKREGGNPDVTAGGTLGKQTRGWDSRREVGGATLKKRVGRAKENTTLTRGKNGTRRKN